MKEFNADRNYYHPARGLYSICFEEGLNFRSQNAIICVDVSTICVQRMQFFYGRFQHLAGELRAYLAEVTNFLGG